MSALDIGSVCAVSAASESFHGVWGPQPMADTSQMEEQQRDHYERIAQSYASHYGDEWSQRFRERFLNPPLLDGVPLAGAQVLDAMCGSGETTGYLLERGANVTALDLSPSEIEEHRRRFPNCRAICASILETGLPSDSFDCVVVVGGLHHVHPHLLAAMTEIHRVLKPGGRFCFMEPHQGSLPDVVRRWWYKRDSLFADNEEAIDLEALKREFAGRFEFTQEVYKGNLAYLLVLNSLIFRVPLWLKRWYAPPLFVTEGLIERFQGRRLSCIAIGQWTKR